MIRLVVCTSISASLSGYPYFEISEISRSVLPVEHIVHVQSYTTPRQSTPTMAHPSFE